MNHTLFLSLASDFNKLYTYMLWKE